MASGGKRSVNEKKTKTKNKIWRKTTYILESKEKYTRKNGVQMKENSAKRKLSAMLAQRIRPRIETMECFAHFK